MAGRVRGLLERILARRREAEGEGVPDSELLRRFAHERDEAAFELLVWRHGGMVLGVCRRSVRDEQLAEDAFQAVFLVLARKAGSVRGNLGGWLFKVARRVSARALRQRTLAKPVIDRPAEPRRDSAEREELAALLDAEVARLPERLRRPVILCYLGGRSTEEAARELGCPRGTVLSRLVSARKRLADRLTRRGVTLPASLALAAIRSPLVSDATAAVRAYRTGILMHSASTQLADGVLHAMSRSTLLTALGGVTLAFTLAGGIGWVAAQPGREPAAGGGPPSPVAALPLADPPAKKPAAQLDAGAERIKKLEQWADTLRTEIEVHEKQIERLAKTLGDADQMAQRRKQRDEVEEEYRRVSRELARIEAEGAVLKKLSEKEDASIEPDPLLVQQEVNRDPTVVASRMELDRVNDQFSRLVQLSPMATPQITELKKQVATAEKRHAEAVQDTRARVVVLMRKSEQAALRQRLGRLATEILIKKEQRDRLKAELEVAQKMAGELGAKPDVDALQQSLAPLREVHARVQRELLLARLARDGITLPEERSADPKLDQVLRELVALRKEVQELKAKK